MTNRKTPGIVAPGKDVAGLEAADETRAPHAAKAATAAIAAAAFVVAPLAGACTADDANLPVAPEAATSVATAPSVAGEGSASGDAAVGDPAAAANLPQGFDLQSHRGGRGEWTEESAAAMRNSLELGVTTLELDIVMSKDGVPVVWHDPVVEAEKCSGPYVGQLIKDLTFAQLQELTCDKKLENFPDAEAIQGNTMINLADLFELATDYPEVHFNIETKIEAAEPDQSKTPEEFVNAILDEIDRAGVADRAMIQSFDWRTFPLVAARNPEIPLVLLWDETTWLADSPWTGTVDYSEVDGDIFAAAQQLGVHVLSPGYAVPYGTSAGDSDYHPVATADFVARAHDLGFKVVPWTINDAATMNEQIAAGVDGIITDYPTLLRQVMADRDMELPGDKS